jgi:hypothetical protein
VSPFWAIDCLPHNLVQATRQTRILVRPRAF